MALTTKTYYTYLWLRQDGTPYYVGKGTGKRGFVSFNHRVKCPTEHSRIIVQEQTSEAAAFSVEKFLIAYYGRLDMGTGCLRNMTDGGENPPRVAWTLEMRAAARLRKLGNTIRRGSTQSEESNRKNREAHKDFRHSAEAKKKIGDASRGNQFCLGRKDSIETKERKRIAAVGNQRARKKVLWP